MNRNDPILGFFHRWVCDFAKYFEKITVICLQKGEYDLPSNVKVLSLGKEEKQSRIQYLSRFYSYILKERKNYDVVLSHMNQEYVLLAGFIWWLLGKRIYMWRNHHVGDELTDMAAFFCKKIFCTSKYSYTMKYKKTVLMPVGIDLNRFKPLNEYKKKPHSILFLSRMAPIKKPDLLIEALNVLSKKGIIFSASFYGNPEIKDELFYESLKEKVNNYKLGDKIKFYEGIPNEKTIEVYNLHEIFVNLSSSGMYDKTIFEAMACGCVVLVSNDNLKGNIDDKFIFNNESLEDLVSKLESLLNLSDLQKKNMGSIFREYALNNHSLTALSQSLLREMS